MSSVLPYVKRSFVHMYYQIYSNSQNTKYVLVTAVSGSQATVNASTKVSVPFFILWEKSYMSPALWENSKWRGLAPFNQSKGHTRNLTWTSTKRKTLVVSEKVHSCGWMLPSFVFSCHPFTHTYSQALAITSFLKDGVTSCKEDLYDVRHTQFGNILKLHTFNSRHWWNLSQLRLIHRDRSEQQLDWWNCLILHNKDGNSEIREEYTQQLKWFCGQSFGLLLQ